MDKPIDELVDYWKWVENTYGMDVAKAIAEHGELGRTLLDKYKDAFVSAIRKAGNADDVVRLVTEYADNEEDVLRAISRYGDEAVELITKYGDEAVELFKEGKSLDEVKTVFETSYV